MKKYFILAFILFCGLLFSQDFRKATWGMNKEEVKKNPKYFIYRNF